MATAILEREMTRAEQGEKLFNDFLQREAEADLETLRFAKAVSDGWHPARQERRCDGCGQVFDVTKLTELYFHNQEVQYWFHSEKELVLWANSRLRLADEDDDSEEIDEHDSEQEEIEESD